MPRADDGLAFLLRYENVAWYEEGTVRILDRRVYPHPVSFVTCHTTAEVAQAIRDMVTQSAGPYLAAAMGMALAGWECRGKTRARQWEHLTAAAQLLANARPTTAKRMRIVVNNSLAAARRALDEGSPLPEALFDAAIAMTDSRYRKIERTAAFLADVFPQEGVVMTQCFAETIVGFMLKEAAARGLRLQVICPETRPYFQGARLTASVVRDQGFPVTVITDNMPAWAMHEKGIAVFTSAADAITMDGYVVNKVGTFQIALAARHFGIPYYVTGAPDRTHERVAEIPIEQRDPALVLEALGKPTAGPGVAGWYPAFDVTPPELIAGVVTDRGIYDPLSLYTYYDGNDSGEYEVVL